MPPFTPPLPGKRFEEVTVESVGWPFLAIRTTSVFLTSDFASIYRVLLGSCLTKCQIMTAVVITQRSY